MESLRNFTQLGDWEVAVGLLLLARDHELKVKRSSPLNSNFTDT